MRASYAVEEALRGLGQNIRTARLRRRIPQSVVAERSGISINTLGKIENGDPGVSIGNIASVLQALGLLEGIGMLAAAESDETGLRMEAEHLPQRVRAKRKDSF